MPSHSYVPAPPLSDFVELIWIAEGYSAAHAQERVLPTGSMDLVIGIGESDAIGCVIAGARSESFLLDTSKPFSVIGVHFAVGGGSAFFEPPAGELHNLDVPLDALWGRSFVADTRQQLLEAKSSATRFLILERALLARLRRRWLHRAVAYGVKALSGRKPCTVSQVTQHVGMSHRAFVEAFRNQTGLTPKVFFRIRRFSESWTYSMRARKSTGRRLRSPAGTSIRLTLSTISARSPA